MWCGVFCLFEVDGVLSVIAFGRCAKCAKCGEWVSELDGVVRCDWNLMVC